MTPTTQCAHGLTFATLSAWRDGFLAAAQAERIARHVPDCPACQSILAEFTDIAQRLNTLSEPAALHTRLRQTIWSNLQSPSPHQGASYMPQAATIRRSAAAIGAVALIIVFALTFHLFPHPSSSSKVGSHLTPTATPANTLLPPRDLMALPNFPFTRGFDITPDGTSIVGLGPDFAVDAYSVTSHAIHTLVPAPQHTTSISGASTDGRYINWATGTGGQKAVSGGVQVVTESDTLWVYDTQTHQQSALTTFERQPNETTLLTFANPIQTFQGMVLWEKQQEKENQSVFSVVSSELHLMNLATRTDQVISANDGEVVAVSWPQVLYGATDAHGAVTAHLKNLQTGADYTIPNLPYGHVATLLTAGRVYGIQEVANNGPTSSVNVEELLDSGSPQAHWVTVTTVTDVSSGNGNTQDVFLNINDQVIVYQSAGGMTIVGRAHGQTMTVKTAALSQGRWLIMQMEDGSYELFDTTKLP